MSVSPGHCTGSLSCCPSFYTRLVLCIYMVIVPAIVMWSMVHVCTYYVPTVIGMCCCGVCLWCPGLPCGVYLPYLLYRVSCILRVINR